MHLCSRFSTNVNSMSSVSYEIVLSPPLYRWKKIMHREGKSHMQLIKLRRCPTTVQHCPLVDPETHTERVPRLGGGQGQRRDPRVSCVGRPGPRHPALDPDVGAEEAGATPTGAGAGTTTWALPLVSSEPCALWAWVLILTLGVSGTKKKGSEIWPLESDLLQQELGWAAECFWS